MRFWRIALFVAFYEATFALFAGWLGLSFDLSSFSFKPITGINPTLMVNPFGNPWFGATMLTNMASSVLIGVYASLTMLGIPAALAAIVQMAASASQVAAIVELVTGRRL